MPCPCPNFGSPIDKLSLFTKKHCYEPVSRLDAVLLVIYLLFNEGYNATGDHQAIRKNMCLEALRLAMMCFHSARFDARIDNNDCLVILEDQDRSLWNKELIIQGAQFFIRSASGTAATAYGYHHGEKRWAPRCHCPGVF